MTETMFDRIVREAAERNAAITAELLASLAAHPDALPVLVRAFVDLVDEADSLDESVWADRGLSTDPGYNDPREGTKALTLVQAALGDAS